MKGSVIRLNTPCVLMPRKAKLCLQAIVVARIIKNNS